MKGPIATVEWFQENRKISKVLANAGLGLVGVGVTKRIKIEYKPGEEVTEERVLIGVNKMIDSLDAENYELKISNPKVISIQ